MMISWLFLVRRNMETATRAQMPVPLSICSRACPYRNSYWKDTLAPRHFSPNDEAVQARDLHGNFPAVFSRLPVENPVGVGTVCGLPTDTEGNCGRGKDCWGKPHGWRNRVCDIMANSDCVILHYLTFYVSLTHLCQIFQIGV